MHYSIQETIMALTPTSSTPLDSLSLHSLDLNPVSDNPQPERRTPAPSLHAESIRHEPQQNRRSAQELALRQQLTSTESAGRSSGELVLADAADAASQAQLAALLHYVQDEFAQHKDGENDDALDALADHRAHRLLQRGENPEDLKRIFAFADMIDASANDAAGTSGSIGFMLANILGGHLPQYVDGAARQGAVSGIATYALLHLFGNFNEKMTAHTPWGKPAPETLDADVAAAVARAAPDTKQKFKEASLNFQAFPATFMTTGMLNSALTLASPATAMVAKKTIGPVTSLVGGAIVAQLGRNADLRHGRISHAQILACDDWESHLDALKSATFLKSVTNGASELSTHTGSKALAGLTQAAQQALLPSTLAKAVVWTGGLALSSWASAQVSAAMAERGFSEADIFTVQQAMFAAVLSPITFAWTSLNTLGPLLDEKTRQAFDALKNMLPQQTQARAQ